MIRFLVFMLFVVNLSSGQEPQEDSEISMENGAEDSMKHKLGKYLYKKFHRKNLENCCQQPGMALNEQILKDCGPHLFKAQASEEDHDGDSLGRSHLCAIECVFKKFGAFNDGDFTGPEFLADGFRQNGEFLGIYVDNYDFCVNRTLKAFNSFPKPEQEGGETACNPSPTMFMICLRSQGFINCPDEMWFGNDQKCNKLKEKLIEYEGSL